MWMWMLLAFLLVALVGTLLVVVAGVVILAVVAVRTDRVGEALIGVARKPPSPVAPPELVGSWHPYGWPPYSSWPTPQLTPPWWEHWP